MSDYSTHDPKGWGGDPSRGAALGRPTIKGEPEGKITVRRSPLDRQGYDRNGTYFGMGAPLFWIADEGGEVDYMDRFADLEDAVKVTAEKYPGAAVTAGEPIKLKCWGASDGPCPYDADADDDYGDQCEDCYAEEIYLEEQEANDD